MNPLFSPAFKVERIASWFIILAISIFCLSYFSNFLQPLVIAIMIWYSIYELKRFLSKIKIKGKALPVWLLTFFAFIIILLIVVGIYELIRSEEHTSELQSRENLVCRLLLEKKNYHRAPA